VDITRLLNNDLHTLNTAAKILIWVKKTTASVALRERRHRGVSSPSLENLAT
jgi:hypothetical protein